MGVTPNTRGQWSQPFGAVPGDPQRVLSGHHAKCAFALRENLRFFLDSHPIESFLFETLTFAEKDISPQVAQSRFASFRRNHLPSASCNWMGNLERSSKDRLHFHLVTQFPGKDFRTGFDWPSALEYQRASRNRAPVSVLRFWSRKFNSSATSDLRERWSFMSDIAPKYGFGRTESRPIRSDGIAIATYLSKYIAKHIGCRLEMDKRVKLVLYGASVRRNTTAIAWNSPGGKAWRARVAALSRYLDLPSYSQLFYDFLDSVPDSEPIATRVAIADSCAREMSGPHFWLGKSWAWSLYELLRSGEPFLDYELPAMDVLPDDLRIMRASGRENTMELLPPGQLDLHLQGLSAQATSSLPLYGAGAL